MGQIKAMKPEKFQTKKDDNDKKYCESIVSKKFEKEVKKNSV